MRHLLDDFEMPDLFPHDWLEAQGFIRAFLLGERHAVRSDGGGSSSC